MTSDFRITLEDEIRDLDRQARLRDWEMSHPSNPVQAPGTTPRAAPEVEEPPPALPAASGASAESAAGETSADQTGEPAGQQETSQVENSEPPDASAEPVPKASDFVTSTKENRSDDDPAV